MLHEEGTTQYSILKIRREMNEVADKLAKQARQASINLVKL